MRYWCQKIIARWLQPKYNFSYVVDLPNNIKNRNIYIVGEKEYPWLIAFNCPCGCKNIVQLNLLKEADPCWTFKINKNGKINIFPSVWRTRGCKRHFVVRKSKIIWIGGYKG
ncbi:MAG: hypothetical protein LLF74_10415 [Bacteroidales bacterium]|nr:hypothetical protein [Bacteroidales bacterium]